MKIQNILIVGAGFWGKKWIEAVQSNPKLRLAGVVARTPASLLETGRRYSLSRNQTFTNVTRALNSVETDIAVIVSPAARNCEHIQAALRAGKHVICEKPLAATAKAAAAIAKSVRAHPRQKFMVAQTRRFTDQVETLHRLVAGGRIGRIDTILFDHRVNYTGGGYRQAMEFPVLEDMICHHLDALRYITGREPVSVYTEAWNPSWSQFSGQASNNVLAVMTGGVHVNYFGSWTARGQLNSYDGLIKIIGSKGSIELVDRRTLLFHPVSSADQGPGRTPLKIPMVKLKHCEIDGVMEAFLKALAGGTQPPCNLNDNLKTFAFNHAVIKSCRTHKPVPVKFDL